MPTGTGGILGTDFDIRVQEDGPATVTVLEGMVEIVDDLGPKVIAKASQQVVVTAEGRTQPAVSIDLSRFRRWWKPGGQ